MPRPDIMVGCGSSASNAGGREFAAGVQYYEDRISGRSDKTLNRTAKYQEG